jgi:hypothetical protein
MAVALLALFVALGGTSYAVSRIDGKQLKNASVSAKKLRRNTLTGREVRESALGEVPLAARATTAVHAVTADLSATAERARHASSADTLSGTTLGGLVFARSSAAPLCEPPATVDKPFVRCAGFSVAVPRTRMLLVGTAGVGAAVPNVPFVVACRLQVDGAEVRGSLVHAGMDNDTTPGMHFESTPFGIATTAVSDIVSEGSHEFALACQQTDPTAVVVDAKISAVTVGTG